MNKEIRNTIFNLSEGATYVNLWSSYWINLIFTQDEQFYLMTEDREYFIQQEDESTE